MTNQKIQLRYFFEYFAESCFWLASTDDKTWDKALVEKYGILISLDKLPLSEQAKSRIRELDEWHHGIIDWGDPGGPSPWTQKEADRFNTAAEELLIKIKEELGDNFEIIDSNYKVIL
jgi:hypothetical protein